MVNDIKNNHITVQGWMITKLNLSGRELLCYALIYGFTQDNESYFYGSRKYISQWLGCTLPTVDSTLKELVMRGLIVKKAETINNVQFNRYKCVELNENYEPKKETEHQDSSKEILGGSKITLQGGKITLLNNNSYNNKDKDKKEIDKSISKKSGKTLEERDECFKQSLQPYVEKYGQEMIESFYLYWSEPNKSHTKMKYEMQQTFDISRRLATWHKNEQKRFFSGNGNNKFMILHGDQNAKFSQQEKIQW